MEKKINGRKRQFLTDTNGFLLRVLGHAADVSDTERGEWLLSDHHMAFPRLTILRADSGYKETLRPRMEENTSIELITIAKPADQHGFVVIPKRWVVERSIAWSGHNRRASKEYERNLESSESLIYLGSIRILLKRLYATI